ncbi:MAG: methyl-accepting chemotaxis protein [Candidatus Heimdallarchaeota archaeon]
MNVLNKIKLGPKLIAGFLLVAAFAGLVGLFGVFVFTGMIDGSQEIRDETWIVANAAMEVMTQIETQVTFAHEYMLGDVTELSEYTARKIEIDALFDEAEGVLGADHDDLSTVFEGYSLFMDILEGNATSDGLFTLTNDRFAAQTAAIATNTEVDQIQHETSEYLHTLEEYAEVGSFLNWTVANSVMELNIHLWEAKDHANGYLIVTDSTTLQAEKANFTWIVNNPGNSENILNRADELEAYIIGGLADSSIHADSQMEFNLLKIALITGSSSQGSWIDYFLDSQTGLFAIRDQELAALKEANAAADQLDIITDALFISLSVLEKDGDKQMNDTVSGMVSDARNSQILMLAAAVVAVATAIAVGFLFARMISNPIAEVTQISEAMADGDLTQAIENKGRTDEIGILTNSFAMMLTNFRDLIFSAQESSMKVASTSEELASTAEEINASTEEVSATVEHIARGAGQQADMATKAIDNVGQMSTTVDDSLREIEGSSDVIQDIAAQTNMLALNAAIEAARAGEYGRGFGVVADNVRVLAENSRTSAAEISSSTSNIVNNVGGSITTIQESVQSIASVAEEFSASAEEVSSAVEEMSASMEEMSSSAQELAQLSEDLSSNVSKFKL